MIVRLLTVALAVPWCACTAGWAAVVAAHTALTPLYAVIDPRRAP